MVLSEPHKRLGMGEHLHSIAIWHLWEYHVHDASKQQILSPTLPSRGPFPAKLAPNPPILCSVAIWFPHPFSWTPVENPFTVAFASLMGIPRNFQREIHVFGVSKITWNCWLRAPNIVYSFSFRYEYSSVLCMTPREIIAWRRLQCQDKMLTRIFGSLKSAKSNEWQGLVVAHMG